MKMSISVLWHAQGRGSFDLSIPARADGPASSPVGAEARQKPLKLLRLGIVENLARTAMFEDTP
jgi:hypothetical protein